MRIGKLAERSGLTASRIRFYEQSGLIGAAERTANGYRRYTPAALLTLEIITSAQKAGFSLDEIRRLVPQDPGGWQHDELLEALKRKAVEIEAMRERLAQSLAQLRGMIETIENRPEGLTCSDNAKRILKRFQDDRD